MLALLARRLLAALATLLIVSAIVFALVQLAAADPAAVAGGGVATPERIDALRASAQLERPLPAQYLAWLARMVLGNLGHSTQAGSAVTAVIAPRLGPTLSLAALAVVVAVATGLPIGVLAAWRPGARLDRALGGVSLLTVSVPVFVLGYLLLWLLSLELGWLPAKGYRPLAEGIGAWLQHLLLPTLALAPSAAVFVARTTRGVLLAALGAPHVHAARARGVPERTLLLRHALGNAALPVLDRALRGATLLAGGIVVVESLFDLPGLGRLVPDAVLAHDLPTLQGAIFVFALACVLVGLLADLMRVRLDPRLRREAPIGAPEASAWAPQAGARAPQIRHRLRRSAAARTGLLLLLLVGLVGLAAPWLGTVDPALANPDSRGLAPLAYGTLSTWEGDTVTMRFVMGSDGAGHDLYSRVLYGARIALALGVTAALLAAAGGLALGLAAGLLRRGGGALMRIVDALASIPALVVAIALVAISQGTLGAVIAAVAIPEAAHLAQRVHSLVLAARARPWVEAASALGTPAWRIMLRDVAAAAAPALLARVAHAAAAAIVTEAMLSFLGVGLAPELPSWGNAIAASRGQIAAHPASVFFPAAFLGVTVLAFNLLGQGLRDALRERPDDAP